MRSQKPSQTIYFLSGTHWDREWYQPFQGFRYRLAEFMDQTLERLETTDFPVFTMDGQTIVLEDYLEIAPENEARLQKVIADGRFLIGPWYCMPDSFLLSGESLIQNLLKGFSIARTRFHTEPWKYGYMCDIFGHTAQIPQILNSFGLKNAVVGRGTNNQELPAHFRWLSPDGSECVALKLNDNGGYGDLTTHVVWPMRNNPEMTREEKRALIQKVIVTERSRSEIPVVFLIDAFDHQNISPELTECVELAREAFPDASVKFVNLEEMGKELEQYRALMPQKTGELISPVKDKTFYNNRIPHTLSSRYDLKHQNALCQTMLEKWADPLTVVCSFTDTPIRKAYSDQAWKWLMQNHPHDSICGCSIEQVHTDMKYRFDQVREIGYEICSHGLETLTDTFPKDHKSQTRLLSIANPLPYPVDNVITVELYFHLDYPEQFSEPFGYESKNCFKILSADGLEVPYHIEKISRREFRHVCGQHQDYFDIHTVSFRANLLPCGITEFRVIPSKTPVRYFGSLLTAPLKAENERLAVEISPFGSLTVRSKETGKSYENLLKVIDDGEIGDGWYHQNPVDDVAVHSAGAAAISVVCDSFDKCVFKITTELRVPEKLDRIDRQIPRLSRSKDTKTLVLHHFVTLKSGAKAVEVETVVENNVEDHRLRLIIPTKSDASRYFAGEAFCFVERPCGFDHNTHDWKEQDPPERPMNGMVGKRDKDGDGLAFLSADGLSECAAYLDKDGIIAVTLLRCFGTAINFYIEKGGQIAGDHHFRYALYPFSKEETYGGFQRFTDQMAAGIQKAEKRISDSFIPNNRQFMELEGDSSLCYSTMKLPEAGEENAVVVRVFNLSDTASKGKLTFSCKIDTADFVNLLEEPLKAAAHDSHSVSLSAEPWKILTLKVTLS